MKTEYYRIDIGFRKKIFITLTNYIFLIKLAARCPGFFLAGTF